MRKKYRLAAVLLFLTTAASAEDRPNSFSWMLGAAIAQSEAAHFKDSVSLQGDYFRELNPWLSLGGLVGYLVSGKYVGTLPTNLDRNQDGKIDSDAHVDEAKWGATFFLTPQIKIGHVFHAGSFGFNPYAVFGGGYYSVVFLEKPSTAQQALGERPYTSYFGINYGGGLMFLFSDRFGIGGDFRVHQLFRTNHEDTIYNVPTLRMMVKF
jgi:hypothetical protein